MAGKGEVEETEGSGHVTWYPEMSSFMLHFLDGLVANGTKTSSSFKKIHLNACARDVNDHCKTNYTGDNVKNHLKTWQHKFAKIQKLRNLSTFGWDEDNCMITLDNEHYVSYVKVHMQDAQFLNKPIEHCREMVVIFGNNMATGKYAKGSNEALGTEEGGTEIEEEDGNADNGSVIPATPEENGATSTTPKTNRATPDDNGATSSAPKPKRAKSISIECEEEGGPIAAFKQAGEKLATAIVEAAGTSLPLGLF